MTVALLAAIFSYAVRQSIQPDNPVYGIVRFTEGQTPIAGYRKMWPKIVKLGDLLADITPHVLRHRFVSLAADLGYNEPTIASLLGHKTHSIVSRYMHSADAVLRSSRCRGECHHEADGVGSGATPVARSAPRRISCVGRNYLFIGVFVTHEMAHADYW